jgi:hypothetical protein
MKGTKSPSKAIKNGTKTDHCVEMITVLFSLISHVNIQLLDIVLEWSKQVLHQLDLNGIPKAAQSTLCRFLFDTISSNFDYTRKNKCTKWLLDTVAELKLEDDSVGSGSFSRL